MNITILTCALERLYFLHYKRRLTFKAASHYHMLELLALAVAFNSLRVQNIDKSTFAFSHTLRKITYFCDKLCCPVSGWFYA